MNPRHRFFRLLTLICAALVRGVSCDLQAQEKPGQPPEVRVADPTSSNYEIEIVAGKLQLARLKSRIIREKLGAGDSSSVDATLRNLVEVLRELHPDANLVLSPGTERIRIDNLKLRASSLENELSALRAASGSKFQWTPTGGSANEKPLYVLGSGAAMPGIQRKAEVFNLSPYLQQFGERDKDEVAETVVQIEKLILETLEGLWPDQGDNRPSFQFHPGANLLIAIGTPDALEVARKVVVALQGEANDSGGRPLLHTLNLRSPPAPNPLAISKERRAIIAKLETIRMESVLYDQLPLVEVIRGLVAETRKLDPEKRGINFLINPNQPAPAPASVAVDPATGLPVVPPQAEPVDINAALIRIDPALSHVRLVDVLDAIVKVSDVPIRYSVLDYGVVFSLKEQDAAMPEGLLPVATPLR